jgi:hypothetical protein
VVGDDGVSVGYADLPLYMLVGGIAVVVALVAYLWWSIRHEKKRGDYTK